MLTETVSRYADDIPQPAICPGKQRNGRLKYRAFERVLYGSFTFDALPYFKNAKRDKLRDCRDHGCVRQSDSIRQFQLSITGDASITITSKQYEVTFGGANNFILSGAITMEADANPSFYNIVSYMKTSFWGGLDFW